MRDTSPVWLFLQGWLLASGAVLLLCLAAALTQWIRTKLEIRRLLRFWMAGKDDDG